MTLSCNPPTLGQPLAGSVDQDPPHGFRRGGEELGAAFPVGLLVGPQPYPGFVHKRGWLQRHTGRLMRHPRRGEATQFVVDERQQSIGGLLFAALDAFEDDGDFPGWHVSEC